MIVDTLIHGAVTGESSRRLISCNCPSEISHSCCEHANDPNVLSSGSGKRLTWWMVGISWVEILIGRARDLCDDVI